MARQSFISHTHDRSFIDRADAGKALAQALSSYAGRDNTIVLALPRGGVPVAHQVAQFLRLPLDIWLVRKLGAPGYKQLAFGAIASGDIIVFNDNIMKTMLLNKARIKSVIASEKKELKERNALYRKGRIAPDVTGKTVIIVDDGLATGATMKAAIALLRQAGAQAVVAAAPVGSPAACAELAAIADDVVCPAQPEPFYSVGEWYEDFPQTSHHEVIGLLEDRPH